MAQLILMPGKERAAFKHRHLLGIEGLSPLDITALLERLNAGLDARLPGAQTDHPPPSAQSQIHVSA